MLRTADAVAMRSAGRRRGPTGSALKAVTAASDGSLLWLATASVLIVVGRQRLRAAAVRATLALGIASALKDIVRELSIHVAVEEQALYPAMRPSLPNGDEKVDHAIDEHQQVKEILVELDGADPEDQDGEPSKCPGRRRSRSTYRKRRRNCSPLFDMRLVRPR